MEEWHLLLLDRELKYPFWCFCVSTSLHPCERRSVKGDLEGQWDLKAQVLIRHLFLVSVLLVEREYDSETCYPGLASQLKPLHLGPLLCLLYEMNFVCFTTASKVKTNSQIIIRILIRSLKSLHSCSLQDFLLKSAPSVYLLWSFS